MLINANQDDDDCDDVRCLLLRSNHEKSCGSSTIVISSGSRGYVHEFSNNKYID
jgi:hypothetical protein